MTTVNIKEIYAEAKRRLSEAGIDDPAFDAACIIEKHTGLKRYQTALNTATELDEAAFWVDIERRERREPLQYIMGSWGFYGLDFFVGKGVLIPRADTEILCETAIEFLKERGGQPRILELCAGSGCVTAAILKNTEGATACCVEISDKAAEYLEKNTLFHELKSNVRIIRADVIEPGTPVMPQFCGCGDFDIIVCNPPYIPTGDIPALEPEVAKYEPSLALDGGRDGLVFYRNSVNYLPLLAKGGMIAFEVGIGQSEEVSSLLRSFGLENVSVKQDYGGVDRVVSGLKPKY